ncbi:MAG: FGGY-family carbohydrate kinase [Candidatus Caldatribacteriaceae bacterium]
MSYLGIDVGTTGCKVIAFDEKGKNLASAYREYPLYHPQVGWVELDAEEVFHSVEGCLQEVSAKIPHDPPLSLGISSQGEAVVPVDREGKVLSRSIVTFDTRGDEFVPFWEEKLGRDKFFTLTGMPLSGVGTLHKILWWKKYQPSVFERARYFLCFEDFLLLRMGVEPAMSFSLAGRTMMFDVRQKRWSDIILSLAGISKELLARTLPSGEVAGEVSLSFREKMGWGNKVVVACGGHDQPCGALGAGVIKPRYAMDATGTVECIASAMDEFVASASMWENNLCCYHHTFPQLYVTLVYNFTGGALLRWYRDQFAEKEKEKAEKEGRDVYEVLLESLPQEPTSLWVLPHFTTTGTPYCDSHSCGMVVGLYLHTKKEEFIKALLEGISYEMKLNLKLLQKAGISVERLRAIGGGAKSPLWLQLKADMYGLPVEKLSVSEAACFGASLLGRKAVENVNDFGALVDELVKVEEVYEPDSRKVSLYEEKFLVYQRIYPALRNCILKGEK